MPMSSISAIAGSMMVGTKNTWVMPAARTASAKYRLPVIRGMGTSLKMGPRNSRTPTPEHGAPQLEDPKPLNMGLRNLPPRRGPLPPPRQRVFKRASPHDLGGHHAPGSGLPPPAPELRRTRSHDRLLRAAVPAQREDELGRPAGARGAERRADAVHQGDVAGADLA